MKILLLISTLAVHLFASSQIYTDKIDATWGEPVKVGKGATVENIIGHDDEGFFLLMSKKRAGMLGINMNYEIWYVKNNLSIAKAEDIKPSRSLNGFDISNILMFDGNLYALGYIDDKRANERSIVVVPIDNKTLSLKEDKVKTLVKLEYDSRRNKGSISYRISENQKAIVIQIVKPYQEGEESKVSFKSYDTNFDIIWENEFSKSVEGEKGVYVGSFNYHVDDEGTVYEKGDLYGLAESVEELGSRDYRKKVKENGSSEIQSYFSVYFKDNEPLRTPLKLDDDKNVHSFSFLPLENGNIAFSGLYGEDGSYSADGVIYFEVDPVQKEITNISSHSFDSDFITQNWSHKAKKKAKKKEVKKDIKPQLYEYEINSFLKLDNGDYCMIAEQYYVHIVTTTTTGANGQVMTTTTYHYYYKDLIVAGFDKSGEFKYVKKIPKRQHSTNDGGRYSSYYAFQESNNVYIIFNDNAENLNVDDNTDQEVEWLNWRKGVCAMATISSNGDIEREWMFNLKDANAIAVPKVAGSVDDKRHLLFTQRKKKSSFVLFELK